MSQDCFVHAGSASILLNPINFTSLHSPVLDHTLDLLPHCQDYQYQPVYHQHGPKHGQIEDLTPTACKAQSHRSCRRVPEFELGKSAHEGLELLIVLRGQGRLSGRYAIFHICVGVEGGVEFGGNEGEEEVQKVDTESVGDCDEGSMARNG